ncbi:SRPBCC family protein [Nocardia sp. NPDC051570]|uniref:SRPBCC family protein n=1 Tax=Nocardia sp. NPDC051570 TaxID=3364324 RepID=UPI00379DB033
MNYPTEVNADAAIVVRLDTRIAAPIDRVWALHTAIDDWPAWHDDITAARLDGPLRPGAVFHWSTTGLDIESTVYAVSAPHRILWGGPAQGITGIHCWTFESDGNGTLVHTEESWDGDPVRENQEFLTKALTDSLHSWLEILRRTAES